MREGAIHTSTVRVVNVSAALDYAVFSCTARNSLGEDKLDIQLVSTSIYVHFVCVCLCLCARVCSEEAQTVYTISFVSVYLKPCFSKKFL